MNSIIGIIWVEAISLILLYILYSFKEIRVVLIIALISRLTLLILSDYLRLPDISDSHAFEEFAWIKSQGGLSEGILKNFRFFGSEFFSSFLAFFYLFLPREVLLLSLISVVVSLLVIVQAWKVLVENCGRIFAKNSVYFLAIFPSFLIYSVQPLREVWVVLFLIMGIKYALNWFDSGNNISAILASIFFVIASFFHEGMMLVFSMFILFYLCNITFKTKFTISQLLSLVIFIPLVAVFFSAIFLGSINLAKLGGGDLSNLINYEYYMYYFNSRMSGSASYPAHINPSSAVDFIWAIPLRLIYFLFSPFILDIFNNIRIIDLFGLIDALIYLIIFVYILKNLKYIAMNKKSKFLLFILMPVILAFSIGVGNYGTAIRHRAKFIIVFLLLLGLKNKFNQPTNNRD
jgi:hypothetical protein